MTETDIDWAEFLVYREDSRVDECEKCGGMGFVSPPLSWLLFWPWDRPDCPDCLGTGLKWPGREAVRAALAFVMRDIDGFDNMDSDRHEFAMDIASERGHDEPTTEDDLDGFLRLIAEARRVLGKEVENEH